MKNNEPQLLSRRQHFYFVLVSSVAVWLTISVVASTFFPAYYMGEELLTSPVFFKGNMTLLALDRIHEIGGFFNRNLIWFIPGGIISGVLIGMVLERLIRVRYTKPEDKEIPFTRFARFGRQLLGWKGLALIVCLIAVMFIMSILRLNYYTSFIFGKVPGLSQSQPLMVRKWAMDRLARSRDPEVGRFIRGIAESEEDEELRLRAAFFKFKLGISTNLDELLFEMRSERDQSDRSQAVYIIRENPDHRAIDILLKILELEKDGAVREQAVLALKSIGDRRAVRPLIRVMQKDSNRLVRILAIDALVGMQDQRAVGPIIGILTSPGGIRGEAAEALGSFGNSLAIKPLVSILQNDSDAYVRQAATSSLGVFGGSNVVPILNLALQNDSDKWVRTNAAISLGLIGDNSSVKFLLEALRHDEEIRFVCGLALAAFNNNEIIPALRQSAQEGNYGAKIALGWLLGGKDKDLVLELEFYNYELELEVAVNAVAARWGDVFALETILNYLHYDWVPVKMFSPDIISRLPKESPEYDFNAEKSTREKQHEELQRWYKENKQYLAWDAGKRRYFLKPKLNGK